MEVFSGVGGAEYLSRLASSDPAHFARCLARWSARRLQATRANPSRRPGCSSSPPACASAST